MGRGEYGDLFQGKASVILSIINASFHILWISVQKDVVHMRRLRVCACCHVVVSIGTNSFRGTCTVDTPRKLRLIINRLKNIISFNKACNH